MFHVKHRFGSRWRSAAYTKARNAILIPDLGQNWHEQRTSRGNAIWATNRALLELDTDPETERRSKAER
jgi:hypothetical protein